MFSIDVHTKMMKIVNLFYRLGIWQKYETDLWKVAPKIFHLVMYSTFGLSLLSGAFLSDDKNEAIFLKAAAMASTVLTVKLGYIMWLQRKSYGLLQEVGTHSISDGAEFLRTNQRIDSFMKFVTVFLSLTFFGLAPILIYCLPIFTNEKQLGLNIGFPLDWRHSEVAYWIAYFYILYSYTFSIVCMLVSVLIWFLMTNCSIKYESLGNQFKNLGYKRAASTNSKERKFSEEEERTLSFRELLDLTNAHQKLKATVKHFGSCFNYLFFTQITTSGLIICGSLYNLAFTVDNLMLSITYFSAVIYNTFDVFMVMYFGNEIELSSSRLSYCLFESNWIDQSKSFKKHIIILTEVLKQPQQLVVFKLYPLNLNTFTKILNVTYRMFNILISLK